MALAASGFAAGGAVAYQISSGAFRSQPAGLAWVVVIGANVAAWMVFVYPTVRRFLAVESAVEGRLVELLLTFCLFTFLFSVPLWPPVAASILRLQTAPEDYLLPVLGGILAGLAMAGVWRIHAATRQLRNGAGGDGAEPVGRSKVYLALQEHLQGFLWVVGTVISLGTLALGLAIQAINQVRVSSPDPADVSPLPNHGVWVYGLYYTTLLALSYAPAHIGLVSVGRSIRDAVAGESPASHADLTDWLRQRQELEGLLNLNQGPVANLKAAIFVLSPLLTSLLSTALPNAR